MKNIWKEIVMVRGLEVVKGSTEESHGRLQLELPTFGLVIGI
jgi:hypothetical protein